MRREGRGTDGRTGGGEDEKGGRGKKLAVA
jgi:hypothetical protein